MHTGSYYLHFLPEHLSEFALGFKSNRYAIVQRSVCLLASIIVPIFVMPTLGRIIFSFLVTFRSIAMKFEKLGVSVVERHFRVRLYGEKCFRNNFFFFSRNLFSTSAGLKLEVLREISVKATLRCWNMNVFCLCLSTR